MAKGAFDRIGSADVTLEIEMAETFLVVRRCGSAFDTRSATAGAAIDPLRVLEAGAVAVAPSAIVHVLVSSGPSGLSPTKRSNDVSEDALYLGAQ